MKSLKSYLRSDRMQQFRRITAKFVVSLGTAPEFLGEHTIGGIKCGVVGENGYFFRCGAFQKIAPFGEIYQIEAFAGWIVWIFGWMHF